MATYVSNLNSGYTTDQKGHDKFVMDCFTGGVLNGLDISVSGNNSISISAGELRIPSIDGTYAFGAWSDSSSTISLGSRSSSSTYYTDEIVAYVQTNQAGGVNNSGALKFGHVLASSSSGYSEVSDSAITSAYSSALGFLRLGSIKIQGTGTISSSNIDMATRTNVSLNPNLGTQLLTLRDGSQVEFAIINAGDDIPEADNGVPVVVFVKGA